MDRLVYLKLGGSLITDKTQPYTPHLDKLDQVAIEIKSALSVKSSLNLILGHGSGSFGHYAFKEQSTLLNLPPYSSEEHEEIDGTYWKGFSEVRFRASQLNRFVIEALNKAGIPDISLPPSALETTQDGTIKQWDLTPLHSALKASLVPVIYRDIVFDGVRRSIGLSTETLLFYLAQQLSLKRVLLAGLEAGVWADFPVPLQSVKIITPSAFNKIGD